MIQLRFALQLQIRPHRLKIQEYLQLGTPIWALVSNPFGKNNHTTSKLYLTDMLTHWWLFLDRSCSQKVKTCPVRLFTIQRKSCHSMESSYSLDCCIVWLFGCCVIVFFFTPQRHKSALSFNFYEWYLLLLRCTKKKSVPIRCLSNANSQLFFAPPLPNLSLWSLACHVFSSLGSQRLLLLL